MRFDGVRYTRTRNVLPLPREHWEGELKNYVTFGRIVKKGTKGAVRHEGYFFHHDLPRKLWPTKEGPGEPDGKSPEGNPFFNAWVLPIKSAGHSLTNLMYGTDGRAYLFFKSSVYIRTLKKKAQA